MVQRGDLRGRNTTCISDVTFESFFVFHKYHYSPSVFLSPYFKLTLELYHTLIIAIKMILLLYLNT